MNKKNASLSGVWVSVDPFGSAVEYRIQKRKGEYKILAKDVEENEQADIYEIEWNERKGTLSFAGYWNSTGRFMRCGIMLLDRDKVGFTYTYTDQDILIRKKKAVPVAGNAATR